MTTDDKALLGTRATFWAQTVVRPGEHTIVQVGDRFLLGTISEEGTGDGNVRINRIADFATLAEAQAALARAKGEAH